MAAVLAAGMIPPLTIGLFSYIYKDRLEKAERSAAYIGIIPALLGLPQVSYPIYVSRGYKVLLPFIAGSSVSSALSMLLGCTAKVPIGGLLTFESSGKPLYLLLSVISGVIVSTIIMTVTIKGESKAKERESDEIIDILPNTAKAKSHP